MDADRIKEAIHEIRDLQQRLAGLERLLLGMIQEPPPAPPIEFTSRYRTTGKKRR